MTEKDLNIKVRDDGVYILETENYRFHLDEKTHIEKIGKLINENEQLKARIGYLERKIQRERTSAMKEHEKWEKEAETKIKELSEENEQLKESDNKAIELILDGIVEMHDGKRDYAETIFNKAIKILKGDIE